MHSNRVENYRMVGDEGVRDTTLPLQNIALVKSFWGFQKKILTIFQKRLTMFGSDDIQILTHILMVKSFQPLKPTNYYDGIWSKW